jgi:hypothetical protein
MRAWQQGFVGKRKEREQLEELYVDVKILQCIWKGSDGRMDLIYVVHSRHKWQTYGYGNKLWVSIESRKFLDKLRKNGFLTKNSALRSYIVSHLVISKINTPLYACNIQSSTIVFLIGSFMNYNQIIDCFLFYLIRVQQKTKTK